jgi:hypothetical protein
MLIYLSKDRQHIVIQHDDGEGFTLLDLDEVLELEGYEGELRIEARDEVVAE